MPDHSESVALMAEKMRIAGVILSPEWLAATVAIEPEPEEKVEDINGVQGTFVFEE